MPTILPSQFVEAIDSLFGPNRNEIDGRAVAHIYRAEVHALLALLDEVPRELIDLSSRDYLEFVRCRAVLHCTCGLEPRRHCTGERCRRQGRRRARPPLNEAMPRRTATS